MSLHATRFNRWLRARKERAFTLLELVIVLGVILVLLGLVLGVGSIVVGQSEQRQLTASMLIVDAAIAEFETQAGRPLIFEGAQASSRAEHCGYRYQLASDGSYEGVGNADVFYDVPYLPYDDDRFTTPIQSGGFGWVELGSCQPWEGSTSLTRRQWAAATLAVLEQNPTCAEMISKADPSLVHAVQCIIGSSGSNPTFRSLDIKEFVDPWDQQVYIIYPGRAFEPGDMDNSQIGPDRKDDDGTIRTNLEREFGICRNRRPLIVSAGPNSMFGDLRDAPGSDDFNEAQDNIYSYEPAQP